MRFCRATNAGSPFIFGQPDARQTAVLAGVLCAARSGRHLPSTLYIRYVVVTADPVFVPYKKSGFAHPKCYLSVTRGCSQKISQEHYISEALLHKIERHNSTIDVCGLSWLPKEHLRSIGKSSLTSGVLCTDHNSALSGFDSEIAKFIDAIFSIDQDFQSDAPTGYTRTIDGTHIERWILKMLVGLVESGQIKQKSGAPFQYKKKCLELICSASARWPTGWGLYAAKPMGQIYHSSSLELLPKHNAATGELLAVALKLNGFEMNFLMQKPENSQSVGVHRPQSMLFKKANITSAIQFNWPGHKTGTSVTYAHSGVYSGPAPTHDLPRAD